MCPNTYLSDNIVATMTMRVFEQLCRSVCKIDGKTRGMAGKLEDLRVQPRRVRKLCVKITPRVKISHEISDSTLMNEGDYSE